MGEVVAGGGSQAALSPWIYFVVYSPLICVSVLPLLNVKKHCVHDITSVFVWD